MSFQPLQGKREHALNRQSWGAAAVLAVLLSASLPGQSGEPFFNPYGLTEDTLDGLQMRNPGHRHFVEFFSAMLLNQRANREAAFAVYGQVRPLTLLQRNVYGDQAVLAAANVRTQIGAGLWNLSSPELLKIEVTPPVVRVRPSPLQFTRGLENRALILVQNGSQVQQDVSLEPAEGPLYFRPQRVRLAPREVHPVIVRVWGEEGESLDLQVRSGRHLRRVSLPLAWSPACRLQIRVLDESGRHVPARVEVVGSDGLGRAPSGTYLRYTPMRAGAYFHTRGISRLVLPAGKTRIRVARGFEHRYQERVVDLQPSGPRSLEFRLERFHDAAARGWYSGDIHIHPNLVHKTMDQVINPVDIRLQTVAEDLNVANLLICNSQGAVLYDRQHFTGAPHPLSTPRHILYWSQELRPALYGHIGVLNLKRFLEPPYNGFPASFYPFDYPSNATAVREVRKEGAAVFYVHPSLGRQRWIPVDAALGAVDGMEILGLSNTQGSNALYRLLLNCGWRLSAVAGTDAFNNVRRHKVLGGDRVYAYTGDKLSYEGWVRALQQGRTFVSNGPLLYFRVQGRLPGSEIALDEPGPVELEVEAHSQVPMEKVEILFNSEVLQEIPLQDGYKLNHRGTIRVPSSGWMAARIWGKPHPLVVNNPELFAHTTPVYLTVGGRPYADPEALEFFLERFREMRRTSLAGGSFESLHQQREVLGQLAEAEKIYRERLKWSLNSRAGTANSAP